MTAVLPHRIAPHVRWMIRRDLPEVLNSEMVSTADPWTEDEILRELRSRHTIGMVSEYRDNVVGHMIYRLERCSIVTLRFVVDRDFRRMGVGTALMTKLIGKLSPDRRCQLVVPCSEWCTDLHHFLLAMGLRATAVIRGDDADIYRFVAFCEPPPASPGSLVDCGGEEVGRE